MCASSWTNTKKKRFRLQQDKQRAHNVPLWHVPVNTVAMQAR